MRFFSLILLGLAGAAMSQYDDYPVGQYEFAHHRIVLSPIKVMGGMDASKRDEGPKVDLKWTPNIDIQELRYEYVLGVEGTFGVGPIASLYLGFDSVKVNSYAVGLYGRYYLGLATGPYAQFNFQWYQQGETFVRDGKATAFGDSTGKILPPAKVTISGPQFSPVLGYNAIFGQHLVLESQMGFTMGRYDIQMPGGPISTPGSWGLPKVYRPSQEWGGFFFVQASLGVAW